MKKMLIVLMSFGIMGCTSPEPSKKLLSSMGYTNIELTGYVVFGCGEHDVFRTGFTAKSPNGSSVDGVVCSGWFKGSTVRFF